MALSSDLKLASPTPTIINSSFGAILENISLDGRYFAFFTTLVMSLRSLIWGELFFFYFARAV